MLFFGPSFHPNDGRDRGCSTSPHPRGILEELECRCRSFVFHFSQTKAEVLAGEPTTVDARLEVKRFLVVFGPSITPNKSRLQTHGSSCNQSHCN